AHAARVPRREAHARARPPRDEASRGARQAGRVGAGFDQAARSHPPSPPHFRGRQDRVAASGLLALPSFLLYIPPRAGTRRVIAAGWLWARTIRARRRPGEESPSSTGQG